MEFFLVLKKRQHTIGQAIDHQSGKFLACAFGDRKMTFVKIRSTLKTFSESHFTQKTGRLTLVLPL